MTDRNYGNVQVPRKARTMGLSYASVGLLLLGGVLTFLLMQFGVPIYYAIAALVVGVLATWFVESGRRNGRTRVERAIGNHKQRQARKRGATTYISGPTSALPDGSYRAPGLLAATEMHEGVDHLGRSFAFLWDASKSTGTVFFTASAAGRNLQDQNVIDYLVAGWGGYLQQTGSLASMQQVSVTVTSMRDAGERLPAAIADLRRRANRDSVSPAATSGVNEIIAATNAGLGRVEARVAVTFSAAADKDFGLEARSCDELMGEVVVHLPAMLEQLELSGGGTVEYLTARDMIDSTYVAYNPSAAVAVERARLSGTGTGLSWEEVGPSYARAFPDRYEHGGGTSMSFQVWRAPAGVFRENSLEAILMPDGLSELKRVTLLYRPLSPELSQARVEAAVTDADYETNQKGRKATGAQLASSSRVKKTEAEIAQGATLVRFSIIITATVLDPDVLRRIPSMVRNACQNGVQLSVRAAEGNEDAAFAIGLGLGVVPAKWATLSPALREAL